LLKVLKFKRVSGLYFFYFPYLNLILRAAKRLILISNQP
jgi:hypothetical protein